MRSRIMVISRDAAFRARLAQLLTRSGYRAEVAESAAEARRDRLDGVALAILAPDGTGREHTVAVEELRAAVGRALIVAPPGAGGANPDCIEASDEVSLLARVAEALADKPEPEATEPTLEFAGYRLDLAGHYLKDAAGKEIPLRPAEFRLLHALVQRAGRVLSRDQLLQITSGRDAEAYDRSVDMQVARLRQKIEADPKRPSIIATVPGAGYKFAAVVHEAKLATPKPSPRAPPTRSDAVPRAPERRHITALVAELAPAPGGRLPSDPEDLSAIFGAFRRSASAVLTQHGGVIGESRGREISAYFGYQMAQENDTERAVRAALAIQRVLTQHNADTVAPKLSARIGLDCGLVVVDSTTGVFGDAPNVAARVLTVAEPGTVLVTINVMRQVSGLFVTEQRSESELVGVLEPANLFRIVRASGGRRRAAARTLTPFVGREEELSLLVRRWERAQAGRRSVRLCCW
jgi:DNA-binding response OmpR family regulator